MSNEQFSQGLGIIEATAKRFDLLLGSRAVDSFRGVARLSFERTVELGGRAQLRAPAFEFSREFVEDLPAEKEYQAALADFLQSLSLRLLHPKPQQFLTLSGVPLDLEIHWPFRAVQTSVDHFIHVLARLGSPWSTEANFTVVISDIDKPQMRIHSLSPPTVERFVVNSIRLAVDEGKAEFHPVGRHPATLQPVRILSSFERPAPTDTDLKNFLKRKVYWLGFREGDERTRVAIADPYDIMYLEQSSQRIRQIARILGASQDINLDTSGQFAYPADKLLLQSQVFEDELAGIIDGHSRGSDRSNRRVREIRRKTQPTAFISYSSEDAPFARSLANALRDRSIGVWLDEIEIRVGDSLTKRIGDALRTNDFIIVVLSPASVRSEWVKKELAEAMTREIKQKTVVVLPVIYRRCEIPPFLTDKKYADFTRDPDSALSALVNSIEQHHGSSVS